MSSRRQLQAIHTRTNTILCERITMACTFGTRLVGLLGRAEIPSSEGLLLQPSLGVHTFGLRFEIDVVFLTKNSKVLAMYRNLPSWRFTGLHPGAYSVLEMHAGKIDLHDLLLGDLILLDHT